MAQEKKRTGESIKVRWGETPEQIKSSPNKKPTKADEAKIKRLKKKYGI